MNGILHISWQEIQAGNETAFRVLYDEYSELLYGYGMKIIDNGAVVMDAIQTLFLNIFEKRKRISAPKSIAAYLCRALKNLLFNELQRSPLRKTSELDENNGKDYDFTLEPDVESRLINDEQEIEGLKIFKQELDKLSHQQREMLYLRYYKGLDSDEISDIMRVSKRTVYNTINNALTRLRSNKELMNFFGEATLMVLLGLNEFYGL